jgi:hypothetical protein
MEQAVSDKPMESVCTSAKTRNAPTDGAAGWVVLPLMSHPTACTTVRVRQVLLHCWATLLDNADLLSWWMPVTDKWVQWPMSLYAHGVRWGCRHLVRCWDVLQIMQLCKPNLDLEEMPDHVSDVV